MLFFVPLINGLDPLHMSFACQLSVFYYYYMPIFFKFFSQQIILREGVPKGTTRNTSLGQLMRMCSAIIIIGMADFLVTGARKYSGRLLQEL
jgi:uncharacterized membrane protein